VKAKMLKLCAKCLSLAIAAENQDRVADRWSKEKLKFKIIKIKIIYIYIYISNHWIISRYSILSRDIVLYIIVYLCI